MTFGIVLACIAVFVLSANMAALALLKTRSPKLALWSAGLLVICTCLLGYETFCLCATFTEGMAWGERSYVAWKVASVASVTVTVFTGAVYAETMDGRRRS